MLAITKGFTMAPQSMGCSALEQLLPLEALRGLLQKLLNFLAKHLLRLRLRLRLLVKDLLRRLLGPQPELKLLLRGDC
jgi:hypothetical protein